MRFMRTLCNCLKGIIVHVKQVTTLMNNCCSLFVFIIGNIVYTKTVMVSQIIQHNFLTRWPMAIELVSQHEERRVYFLANLLHPSYWPCIQLSIVAWVWELRDWFIVAVNCSNTDGTRKAASWPVIRVFSK